jgi:hypothetical protein
MPDGARFATTKCLARAYQSGHALFGALWPAEFAHRQRREPVRMLPARIPDAVYGREEKNCTPAVFVLLPRSSQRCWPVEWPADLPQQENINVPDQT